jgi:hypothetical protein
MFINKYKMVFESVQQKTAGYIYCIYNPAFESFKTGEIDVYKLGRTGNLDNRLASYTTYYVEPSRFMVTSKDYNRKFKDCIKAERVLFYILRKYRVTNKREFFNCSIELIKDTFERMARFSNEMIDAMYKAIFAKIVPPDVIERIEKGDVSDKEWFQYEKGNMDSIFAFLEQFRYRPRSQTTLINEEINKIIVDTDPTIPMYDIFNEVEKVRVKIKFLDI